MWAMGKLPCSGHTGKAILERALVREDIFFISFSEVAKEMAFQREQRHCPSLVCCGTDFPPRCPSSGLALSRETRTHVCFAHSSCSVSWRLYGVNKGHSFSALLEITLQSHKNAQFHQHYITVAKNIPGPSVSSEQ